jgi:hypothetical protein
MADFGSASDSVPRGAGGRLLQFGALGRVYLLESGRLEPYLELWIGGGTQQTHALDLSGERLERASTGLGGRVGGGVDFYLGDHFRLGPSIAMARFFTDKVQACPKRGPCSGHSIDRSGQLLERALA